ncbi:mCG1027633 [Mus musculus]|nr:mCG1027633 [Mus musculus]
MYILIFIYKKNNTIIIIIIGVLKLHISQGPSFYLGESYLPTLNLTFVSKASTSLSLLTTVTPG